jgi:hypothetical protein
MSTNITWKVSGSNWQEIIQAPVTACPMEIATSAVENIWTRPHTGENSPSVGFVLEISHERMKSEGEHVIVLSALVLANAGFHEESAELNRLWEKQKVQP